LADRRLVAVLILGAWVAALGWHVRREFFPSQVERLAAGVRTLPPGVAYYAVFRGERQAGWAQTEIDTLPGASGFRIRDRISLATPGLGFAGAVEHSSEQYLGDELNLDSMRRTSILGGDTSRLRAVVVDDTLVRLSVDAGDAVELVRLSGPITTDIGWRLRLAAAGTARPGVRYGLAVFDPITASRRALEVEVLEAASVAFPDSADTDSISGAWIAVRYDTVQAWRVARRIGDLQLEGWVDQDGRLVDAQISGGYRVERTAFELAFFNRPGAASAIPLPEEQAKPAGDRE
jgi:hypothetical protein